MAKTKQASKKGPRNRIYPDPAKVKGNKKKRRKIAKTMKRLAVDKATHNGSPSTYDSDFARQAIELCKRGATDAELADFFGVTIATIRQWSVRHQDFFIALHNHKEGADKRVVNACYAKATGYTYESEKIHVLPNGRVVRVPTREHVPPSDSAMKFWLTNRQPMDWRERVTNEFDPDKPLKIIVDGGLPTGS